jgi:hypothetical protein
LQGSGQGDLRMCVSRDEGSVGTECVEVKDLLEETLKIPAPCATYVSRCPPVYLTIAVTRTLTQCSGKLQLTTGTSLHTSVFQGSCDAQRDHLELWRGYFISDALIQTSTAHNK